MRKSNQEQLLRDSLDDAGLEAIRQSTLETGLRTLRRGNRRKRQAQMIMLALVPLLLPGVFAYHRSTLRPISAARPIQQTAKVQIIDKEQLFALFPRRPIALIGKPGRQQVVFLDEARESRSIQ